MASSIQEAIDEAIAEAKTKQYVIDAEQDMSVSEDKPCDLVLKRLNVFLQSNTGYTFTGKQLYINKTTFDWYWHYGGSATEPVATPVRDFIEGKLPQLVTAMSLDYAEIVVVDELQKSAVVLCIKGTTGNLAETYTIKVWQNPDTSIGFKIIEKTIVS